MNYIHAKGILHNDIKSDNIVLDNQCAHIQSVLVDFGKACYTQDAKQYHLTATQQCLYEHNHPQVAPDLRDGLCKQSKLSDVYSFGRVMDSVNKISLNLPVLCSLSSQCTEYLQTKRPTTSKLFMFLKNLLSE